MVTYVFKYVVNDMDLKWSVAAAKRSDDHQEMQKKNIYKKIPYISKSVALLDPYEGYLHVQIHLVQILTHFSEQGQQNLSKQPVGKAVVV